MVIAARALDRVICWSFYYADYGHLAGSRYVYWNIFGKPKLQPRFATGFPFTWWIDPAKAEKLLRAGSSPARGGGEALLAGLPRNTERAEREGDRVAVPDGWAESD